MALVNMVKEKSRRHDLDGAVLMTTVFSKNNPILAFNDRKEKTDEDEQEAAYRTVAEALEGRPLIVRTLDADVPVQAELPRECASAVTRSG